MKKLHYLGLVAVLMFTIVWGCSSDEEKKLAHVEKGNAYFEKGEYKSAELEFKNAVQIDPEYVAAHVKLGETYLKLGNSQAAFRTYARVVQLDENNTDAQLKMATFYLLGKQTDKSREVLDKILSATIKLVSIINPGLFQLAQS